MLDRIIKAITIVLIIGLIGYIGFLKMPKASVSSKEVVAEMTATALYEAFIKDESAAQKKYLGKALVVSDIIEDKYLDENGAPVVILRSEQGEPVALVTLEIGESREIERYQIGNRIKIKAQCSGLLMEVTLSKGIVQK